jgi:hypothetical protein
MPAQQNKNGFCHYDAIDLLPWFLFFTLAVSVVDLLKGGGVFVFHSVPASE